MSARANPQFGLRPYLPSDGKMLAAIFRASIEELTGEDYSAAQQEAWASIAENDDEFAGRFADELTLVATVEGSPVGFIALDQPEHIDMLYVHPAVARQGVASMLIDALEKIATGRGTKRLIADASDTARDFFAKRGYVAQQRNTVTCGGEWLGNTTMEKKLGGSAS
ncbi:MAG TPA: GNAT family N-acetyltransferase [Pseudolabrys sp.]|nr:GNAT family N-acetyltransferase [Pseudolabrys sp.]